MILISHRGNTTGADAKAENTPTAILNSLDAGYDVEVDVRFVDGHWWLGHDEPQYKVEERFIRLQGLWLHCKNAAALQALRGRDGVNYFWHQNDDYTIVSNGIVWVYPKVELLRGSICCMPEYGYKGNLAACYGICSDKIQDYEHYRGQRKTN